MDSFDFDLFTIGAGSGGVRLSRMAAGLGAKVAVAEDRFYGGTCVNIGCVPKKLMVMAAHYHEDFEDAAGFGWAVPPASFDWGRLIANKDKEIARLNGIYAQMLQRAGVTCLWGRARILGPHTVEVALPEGPKRVTARHICIATGGAPVRGADITGGEHALVSDDMFYLKDQPKRIAILGGGYIAVEFAGIFNGLGSAVLQLYRGPMVLRGFDAELPPLLVEEMRRKGIDLRLSTSITRIERGPGGLTLTLTDGSTAEVDAVLLAIGRRPNVAGLGLETVGVKLNKAGAIIVDEYGQTTAENIYAIGDVTDRVQLTPVALAEGTLLARGLFGGDRQKMDYQDIPTAVFSTPPIATVGLTEARAREIYGAVDIYASRFRPMKHTLSGREERSFMKLVVEQARGRVVGAHMLGADAPEIIQGIAIAIKCGATKAQFDATIGIHPTAAEEFVTMREKRA